jgi:SdpC family antimicrobial peptide
MKKLVYFVTPAILALAIISCAKETMTPNPASPQSETSMSAELKNSSAPSNQASTAKLSTPGTTFTDEELFLAIFFLKGDAADEVKALANLKTLLTNGELNLLSNRGDNVVEFLNQNDPKFISSFGATLRKADHQNVEAAIDDAVNIMTKYGISNDEGPNVVQQLQAGKNCHKWVIVDHFLIRRRLSSLTSSTGNIHAPEVELDKNVLVNDIVASLN